jgi:two-component system sensor histidine kinase/response regulator
MPDPLDHSRIALLRDLDDGDGVMLDEIVDLYLTQAADGRSELDRVAGQGDTYALERAAHTLRGASAELGASALAAVCAEMEVHARSGRPDLAAGLMARFDTELGRVRDALNRLVTRT